ncbi:MAG: hypothetical protein LBF94_02340 [Puniceicoccales bacterium]|jgi:hypothetical protein|nr:hypothetical protein [Puniceicoccales bacterium]
MSRSEGISESPHTPGSGVDSIAAKRNEILGKTSIRQWQREGTNLYSKVSDNGMPQRVLHHMSAKAGEVLGKKDPLAQRIWHSIQTFFTRLVAQICLDDKKSADFAFLDELNKAIENRDAESFKAVLDIFETRYPGTKDKLKDYVKSNFEELLGSGRMTSSMETALLKFLGTDNSSEWIKKDINP